MSLVSSKELFQKALEGKYAIGAFNVNNMELVQGIVNAGQELNSPLILQISAGARKYANPIYLRKLIEAAIETTSIPIVMHLDHGENFEMCKACIDGGYTSVMIDGSHFPFEENVAMTKQVVEYAHAHGVVVEAELGQLIGEQFDEGEEGGGFSNGVYTDPDKAAEFVQRTGCDSLAVAIGTSHGAYKFKSEPKLDFERLEQIKKKVGGLPLVLHGASSVLQDYVAICNEFGGKLKDARGVPEEMFPTAISMGVTKINVDTDLRLAFTAAIRKEFANGPDNFDPRKYLGPARDAVMDVVRRKMKLFGSAGKA